jgi:hypothetical protein
MKKSKLTEVRRKMKTKKNKPVGRVKEGRISLLKWENSNKYGEPYISYSLIKTIRKRSEDDPSKFEEQLFTINGLTKKDLKDINELIKAIMPGEEGEGEDGWSE